MNFENFILGITNKAKNVKENIEASIGINRLEGICAHPGWYELGLFLNDEVGGDKNSCAKYSGKKLRDTSVSI